MLHITKKSVDKKEAIRATLRQNNFDKDNNGEFAEVITSEISFIDANHVIVKAKWQNKFWKLQI